MPRVELGKCRSALASRDRNERILMYSESERPWFAWFFVLALLIVVACYANWGFQNFEKGWGPENSVIPFVMTGIPGFVVLGFFARASWTYFVREDGFGLQFGFTGWSVHFDYSDIIEAKRVDVSWTSWGGLGWRWRPGRIGYLVRSGPGVRDCQQTIPSHLHVQLPGP